MTEDELRRVLIEQGVDGYEGEGGIHSWRCHYPDMYGPCTCFQDVIEAILALAKT